jgi:hypothetical protein
MADVPVAPALARSRSIGGRLNSARDFQQGIEPFPASRGGIYRVRAMEVNTPKFSNRKFA